MQLTHSQINAQMVEFYSNRGYIFWHQTWFGSMLQKLNLPTRHFPYRWIGYWAPKI